MQSIFQKVITTTICTLYTVSVRCLGIVFASSEKGQQRREGGHEETGKSSGARKQTNKAKAAVIKSSLVLVMHRNAAEHAHAPITADPTTAKARRWFRPWLGPLPRNPLCFHLSWHVQGNECSGSVLLCWEGGGERGPLGQSPWG